MAPRFSWFFTIIVSCFAILSTTGFAQEKKWTHYGLRPLAMGNAYVAVADDYNALFYNPAGLARLKEWDGEFLNPSVEVSKKTMDFVQDAQDLASGSSSSTQATMDLIEKNAGESQHFAIGLTPHLIFKNFGFGIGLELLDATMQFHRYPSVQVDVGPRAIIPFSFAFNALEDRLSFGFSVKARVLGGIHHEFSIQDLDAFKKQDKSATGTSTGPKLEDYVEGGVGYGADVGLLFTPIKTMEPTIGVSLTDVGGTSYKKLDVGESSTSAPDPELPSLNVGISLKPLQAGRMYLLTSMDMHSINQPYSFSKKFNMGTELGLGDLFKIQAGLHQGYLSGGFQFDVGLINLRLISYAEEIGSIAGQVPDRRYAAQVKILF